VASWVDFYNGILREIDRISENENCEKPFFRGVVDNTSKLLPTLFKTQWNPVQLEMNLFIDFESKSSFFYGIESSRNSWDILTEMRHHRLPTRLLDWTGSFAVSLYFALRDYKGDTTPCIFIMNPFLLNEKSIKRNKIASVVDNPAFDYKNQFLRETGKIPFDNPVAIYPLKSHARLLAQDGFFTVHGMNIKPIDEIYPDLIKRFDIPKSIIEDAMRFLHVANINEFTLYPDIDGLCRQLIKENQL